MQHFAKLLSLIFAVSLFSFLSINGVDMDYCPDQYGRSSNDPAYPGTAGQQQFQPICHYLAGTDYASSTINKIEVKEIDWSSSFSEWEWEIWYR